MRLDGNIIENELSGPPLEAERTIGWAEKTGICLSAACAIHCLTLPILVSVLPFLGLGFLLHGVVEVVVGASAVLLGLACVWRGWKQHGQGSVWVPFALAAFLITAAVLTPHGVMERILYAGGGMGLIGAHLLNRWHGRGKALCSCLAHGESLDKAA